MHFYSILEPSSRTQEAKATVQVDSKDNTAVVLRFSGCLKAHYKLMRCWDIFTTS